ncbi:tRNA isopentenyltransferase MiaA [Sphaerochaeta pleomorpha str. Grapes]|uniref:tRNA dimethylallyltransferase n=1 Tax=Sphaerochaeta pleomorpha (strain ATCC BAA-1885 / DSM 22778 / Grapes) TaxID=158190 RepID=G8QR42_SPHPG|nr:tRNA (adenosine(37)-N6)-dimethylallyltransferase MiaA [Sphaerochaeta pleomorpha]AEV30977.1 tRNA isopentenyltransferase MiaA [Sphaerochaeta pleomorpha str. Grapes]
MARFTSSQLTSNSSYNPVIFLFGPTGVGKTELLLNLFKDRFSVVNADSIQVYRHLDIGSAKASKQIQEKIPHYLIDIFDPWEQFSVGDFIELADKACEEIRAQGRIPILSGGTAYYFKHFLYGLSEAPASDEHIRARVAQELEEKGGVWAYARLCEIDPVYANKIHPSDLYRISRALEVFETSGRPLSSYVIPSTYRNNMHPLILGLHREKQELKERIIARVQQMFDEGLIEEIRTILQMGGKSEWPGLQGIGYKEFFQAMESGEVSLPMIADQIAKNSRSYAKRQMTFFKSFAEVNWMQPDDQEAIAEMVAAYLAKETF